MVSSVLPPVYSDLVPWLKARCQLDTVIIGKYCHVFELCERVQLDYNLILLVENECWESLHAVSFSNLLVLSGINLSEVSGWVQGGKLLGSSGVLWGQLLAVTAIKIVQG